MKYNVKVSKGHMNITNDLVIIIEHLDGSMEVFPIVDGMINTSAFYTLLTNATDEEVKVISNLKKS